MRSGLVNDFSQRSATTTCSRWDITEAPAESDHKPQHDISTDRLAHCDAEDSDAPQCLETDVSENNRNSLTKSAWYMWPEHNGLVEVERDRESQRRLNAKP